jgi:hypothetical protein
MAAEKYRELCAQRRFIGSPMRMIGWLSALAGSRSRVVNAHSGSYSLPPQRGGATCGAEKAAFRHVLQDIFSRRLSKCFIGAIAWRYPRQGKVSSALRVSTETPICKPAQMRLDMAAACPFAAKS